MNRILDTFPKLKSLNLKGCKNLKWIKENILKTYPHLERINLSKCKKAMNFNLILTPNVTHLFLSGLNLNELPANLSSCEKLIHLDLSYSNVSEVDFKEFPNLKTVALDKAELPERTNLEKCYELEEINLEQYRLKLSMFKPSEKELNEKKVRNVQKLTITNPEDLEVLVTLPKLRVLKLFLTLNPKVFEFIPACKNLSKLDLLRN